MQASTLVGRKVQVPSNLSQLTNDGLSGTVYLEQSVQQVNVNIKNSQGEIVKHLSLGNQNAGNTDFKWNGIGDNGKPLPAGIYRIAAQGMIGNNNMALPTLATANVDSVTIGKGGSGLVLNLAGLDNVNFKDVYKII